MESHLILQLIDLHRQQLEAQVSMAKRLGEIVANTKPLAATPLLTERKIYKQEAIQLLGISERTYERHKANGLLKPRGLGHDFFYPADLEAAMAESVRKGRV